MIKDTINLRHEADFCIEVYPHVYWVPANSLGSSRYTNDDINDLLELSPEEKQKSISTLYEAIQLYQISKFNGYIDNVRVLHEDTVIMWAFHKPGYYAVKTNGGCCAADTNWLNYILKDKYQETGCFGFYQADGNGQITNYIRQGDWYYFVDMMPQRYDQVPFIGIEDGNIETYKKNLFQGYIYKSHSFDHFIEFYMKKSNPKPSVFYYAPKDCYCTGNQYSWEQIDGLWGLAPTKPNRVIFYKNTVNILYSESNDMHRISDTVALEPDWRLADQER